jgi:hypothetical protein
LALGRKIDRLCELVNEKLRTMGSHDAQNIIENMTVLLDHVNQKLFAESVGTDLATPTYEPENGCSIGRRDLRCIKEY